MKRIVIVAVVAVISLAIFAPMGRVQAHEPRTLGIYTLTVGWSTEPPATGERNAVEMFVTYNTNDTRVPNENTSLNATLIYGTSTKALTVEATFGENGSYTGDIILTRPGTYNVTVYGHIGSQSVNEKYQLERVVDRGDFEFPTRDPAPSDLGASVSTASSRTDTAMTMATGGLILGAIATVIAVLAHIRRPRGRSPP